jgi:hypothetical protein
MIRELTIELQRELRKRGCPFTVLEREASKTTTFGRERIVLEHDEGGDRFGPPRSQTKNPKGRFTRTIGLKLTIYAQSNKSGALEFEHRRRAEEALDQVLIALAHVAADRHNAFVPGSGRFKPADDLAGSDRHGGAVYELSFTFDRAVTERTWVGEIQPEATIGGADGVTVTSTTKVSRPGGDEDETACGA